jgi:hypothetical protein
VRTADRVNFESAVRAYESSATLAGAVTYRGTYSVTVSAVAPDFEYRTFWGLDSLANLDDLNTAINAAPALLLAWLNLISPDPAMRTEIMGRTANSRMITSKI